MSPAGGIELGNIVLMSLPGPEQVAEVVDGPHGLLVGAHPELIVVDLSTVDPLTTQQMASQAGASPVLTEATQKMNEQAQFNGLGTKDTAVMWQIWQKLVSP